MKTIEELEVMDSVGDAEMKQHAEIRSHIATLARLNGDLQKAMLYIDKALSYDPENSDYAATKDQLDSLIRERDRLEKSVVTR